MDVNNILEDLKQQGIESARLLGENSEALGRSAKTTVEIGIRAANDLLAGDIDLTGAMRVSQRGFEQLRTAATAEGNLVAASFVGFFENAFASILKLVSGLPKAISG